MGTEIMWVDLESKKLLIYILFDLWRRRPHCNAADCKVESNFARARAKL